MTRIFCCRFTCTVLFSLLAVIHCAELQSDDRPKIFDEETGQYFPISDISLRDDPALILPPIDSREFPPEFLESLLRHCDDPLPSYWEFFQKAWIGIKEFGLNWERYPVSPGVMIRIVQAVRPLQLFHVFVVAVLLSFFRVIVQNVFLNYLHRRWALPRRTTKRFLESSWKSFWFLVLWSCSLYTVILSGRTDFAFPLRMLKGLRLQVGYFDIPTPPDYYMLYTLQLGFYLHSLWSALFIDVWRKDSVVLIVHHFMTLLLLQFSLVLRLHRVGAIVVFLHDLNDVFLELAKINVYLGSRNGRSHSFNVALSNLFFTLFTITWVIMRLYWYPLKVLYVTSWGLYITNVGRECRSFLFFNSMLWGLFFMHLYWFRLIVLMAIRLVLCPSSGDVREEGVDEADMDETMSQLKNSKQSKCSKMNGIMSSPSVGLNHCMSNGSVKMCKSD